MSVIFFTIVAVKYNALGSVTRGGSFQTNTPSLFCLVSRDCGRHSHPAGRSQFNSSASDFHYTLSAKSEDEVNSIEDYPAFLSLTKRVWILCSGMNQVRYLPHNVSLKLHRRDQVSLGVLPSSQHII